MPYLFEDPYITTGVQFAGIWHQTPSGSVFSGGQLGVVALQARLAITERLALIATKDGLAIFRPDVRLSDIDSSLPKTSLLKDRESLLNITLGIKYALLDWRQHNFILTPSLRFELPSGDRALFQGQGNGIVIPAFSFGWGLENLGLEKMHAVGGFGAQLPLDTDRNSTSLFYNLQLGYWLTPTLAPFMAVNGMYWTDSGTGQLPIRTAIGKVTLSQAQAALGTGAFEGADMVNLGSAGIAGASLVWLTWGARMLLTEHWSVGAAYDLPVSSREDVFNQRATVMLSYEF